MSEKIGNILLELGISPNLLGFDYIIDMVELINSGDEHGISAQYRIIANKRDTDASRVERAIRYILPRA